MHISYLTTEYAHNDLPPAGGIGSFIKGLSQELIKRGNQVTVFLILCNEEKTWFDGEVRIVQIKNIKYSILRGYFYRKYLSKVINEYSNKLNIDLIESVDWEGWHSFIKTDIPIITRLHGSVSYFNKLEKKKNNLQMYYYEKKALKNTQIVAVSSFAGRFTKEVFNLKDFHFTTIHNGVNIDVFNITEKPENSGTPRILYFGTLARKKGVLEIPSILNILKRKYSNFEFVLIGKDSIDFLTKKSVWGLFQNSCDDTVLENINYKGVQSYESMKNQIATADICVFPSFAEAFPLSWLEAMAMSKAVIASNIGWAPEMITNGLDGILIHPEDHELFASQLLILLKDEQLRKQFGKNARLKIERDFNNYNLINNNIEYYKEIIDNAK